MTSFQEIYDAYKNLVYNLALQYVQNPEDAEEITQDVFLNVYQNLDAFRQEAELKTWIYRIVINKSLDYIKARTRRKRWSIFGTVSIDDPNKFMEISSFNHPGVELEQKEGLARLFTAINKLPENQKTALILLKVEQLSQNEAAIIMNTSTKAVESLFQRAKVNLKNYLKESEGL